VQPLALTLGEPAGIGPDLAVAVWRRRVELDLPRFYLIADPDFIRRRAERLNLEVPIATVTPAAAAAAFPSALPVVDLDVAVSAEPGRPDRSSAPAAIASLRRAVADVLSGAAAAVVTSPVAKNVLYSWGFAEPGQTEFLATLAQDTTGKWQRPVMMLWSPELAVVPVTIHLPLREIFAHLSTELVIETGRIVARDLAGRFRIPRPRLAVAGLNPHAGEEGTLGDSLFHRRARASYDAALCMYHDQALIPIKTLAFDHAVNVTLGLPFVRTSPDHGTAFDIAGTGTADATSLVAALRLAARLAMADNRAPLAAS
jgi:4-hydroxythreonine-4-phosphate dehydrogenase